MWDLSLVDPDNRRPVGLTGPHRRTERAALEAEEHRRPRGSHERAVRELARREDQARGHHAAVGSAPHAEDLFATGGYEALTIEGAKADQALGYLRSGGSERLAVFVARYPGFREVDPDWCGTSANRRCWTDWLMMTCRSFKGGSVAMADYSRPFRPWCFVRFDRKLAPSGAPGSQWGSVKASEQRTGPGIYGYAACVPEFSFVEAAA
jgi:hypothetical protein